MSGKGGVSRGAAGLYGIIALKLGKSLLLFGITLGIYSLMDEDLGAEFERFLRWVRLDPEHQFFADLGEKLQVMTPSNVQWIASGTLLYGVLLLVESLGMAFRASWAGWLAIGETAFFIPIEVFELVRHFSPAVFVILIVNGAIVWYLIRNRDRLFHHDPLAANPSTVPENVEPSR
ncbi:MAG TPA: DUF2127 domain-containing protein [Candidatus Polarisedimenticolia bacterium]|jgi:uncharacterized membrane protein (DUF2068 family)|nr:DUF2127 domain-containing protein [Candidatus Polarisedimenticolia bacterium]